ncbi:hypothetical protein PC116_g22088 [Phytophthora cactorum]|nr:hypothetical protein PC116_g22088 [Phytophthora cactorum]
MGDVGAGVNDADFEGVGEGAPKQGQTSPEDLDKIAADFSKTVADKVKDLGIKIICITQIKLLFSLSIFPLEQSLRRERKRFGCDAEAKARNARGYSSCRF